MSLDVPGSPEWIAERQKRLIWISKLWPQHEHEAWLRARAGKASDGRDNLAFSWRERTVDKHEDGYGRYLAWLARQGLFLEDEPIACRVTPERIAAYTACLKEHFPSSVSVAIAMSGLCSAIKALAPEADWRWLSRRTTRLKLKATPSRDKRKAMQPTLDLYRFGKHLMNTADRRMNVPGAQRYQAGMIIALLAARPLRIRNFQVLTIGQSLCWDGRHYRIVFSARETKTGSDINEPVPHDLIPYLEAFLKTWRPVLLRQAPKFGENAIHRRLWVDRAGKPMEEATLRSLIARYTVKKFGTALWPHLFRHCLLTSVAIDQPDLMRISPALLGHSSYKMGEKHYNQARMIDASRQFGAALTELREGFLAEIIKQKDTPKR